MKSIEKTSPHYIRCIKPNPFKSPGIFEKPKVLDQLRCGGVLESVIVALLHSIPYVHTLAKGKGVHGWLSR